MIGWVTTPMPMPADSGHVKRAPPPPPPPHPPSPPKTGRRRGLAMECTWWLGKLVEAPCAARCTPAFWAHYGDLARSSGRLVTGGAGTPLADGDPPRTLEGAVMIFSLNAPVRSVRSWRP